MATRYFNNGNGTGLWSDPLNWTVAKPGPTDNAYVHGFYYNGPITIDENVNVANIQFTGTGANPYTSVVTKQAGYTITATSWITFALNFTGTVNMTDGLWQCDEWRIFSLGGGGPWAGTINPGTSKVITHDIFLDDENYAPFYDLEIVGNFGATVVTGTVNTRKLTVANEFNLPAGLTWTLQSCELEVQGDLKVGAGSSIRGGTSYYDTRVVLADGASVSQMDGLINLEWDGTNGDAEIIFRGGHVDDIEPGQYGAHHIIFEQGPAATPNKTVKLKAGTYTFKTDPTFYIGPVHPELVFRNGGATTTYTIDNSNDPDLVCLSDIKIDEDTGSITYTKGTGDITLGGFGTPPLFYPDIIVEYDLGGKNVEAITVDESYHDHIHRLTGTAACTSFDLVDGKFDFNGQTISTDANFDIAYPAEVYLIGLAASYINVGGNATLAGQSGGPALLDLSGSADWFLDVTGTGTATYVDVAYSDASAGSTINADINSVNGGHNDNWSFVLPTWDVPDYLGSPGYLIDSEEVKADTPAGVNPGRCGWNDVPLSTITRGIEFQCRVRQLVSGGGGALLHMARVTEQSIGNHPFVRIKGVSGTELELEVGVMDDSFVVLGSETETINENLAWATDGRLSMILLDGSIVGRFRATDGSLTEKTYLWTSSGNYVRFAFSLSADNRLDDVRCLAVGGT